MQVEMREQILKWAALLMSNIPSRLRSGFDIKMALEGYVIALEDTDFIESDLKVAVDDCIAGRPTPYDWCPQPAVVRQLVRDARARRVNANVLRPQHAQDVLALIQHLDEFQDYEERKRMSAKADKLIADLVANTDARKVFNWAEFLTRRQPPDLTGEVRVPDLKYLQSEGEA